MSTAVEESERASRRSTAARVFGIVITQLIRDYIPPKLYRGVEETLAKAAYDQGLEMTTLAMREEYEARGRLLLDIGTTGQFSPQHEATPHG